MRIVSGKFRAKKLAPPTHNIRPTLDKVKQSLFTKLQFFVEGSKVLDLFCGSGALGIEAISRNASRVVFCDNNEKSIALTKKNIASLKLENSKTEISVIKNDYKTFLENTKESFDLIIIDPPYESDFYYPALALIKSKKLLAPGGVIVCERLKSRHITQDLFENTDTKIYGSVALDYFEEKPE